MSVPCVFLSSRFFHWKLGLYAILFVLIAVLPFYIAFYVISTIRLGEFGVQKSLHGTNPLCQ